MFQPHRSNLSTHLTVLLVLVLTACSNGPSTSSTAAGQQTAPAQGESTPYVTSVPSEVAGATAAQALLVCDEVVGGCPDALAMALTRVDRQTKTDFYQCTSFLIAKDLMATNAHCLPKDLRVAGASCRDRMHFYFGRNDLHRKFVATCGQIVSVSEIESNETAPEYNLRPDIAIIRLASPVPARQPLRLSQDGVSDEMNLQVLSIDPVEHSADTTESQGHEIRGQVHVRTCVAKQRSLLTPQFTNDFGSVISAACTVIQGNSGSPALDSEGRVRAILHARRSSDMIGPKTFTGFELPSSFVDMAELTNMTCADLPDAVQTETGLGSSMSSCREPIPSRDRLIRTLEESKSVDVGSAYQAWLTNLAPSIFTTELEELTQPGFRGGVPRLTCVRDPQTWLGTTASKLRLDSLDFEGNRVTLSLTIPLWGSKAALDRFERVSASARTLDRAHTVLSFDLGFVKTNGFVRFTKSSKTESGQLIDSQGPFDLTFCR